MTPALTAAIMVAVGCVGILAGVGLILAWAAITSNQDGAQTCQGVCVACLRHQPCGQVRPQVRGTWA